MNADDEQAFEMAQRAKFEAELHALFDRLQDIAQGNAPAWLLKVTQSVLREREAELLELKGPCSTSNCGLHHAHRGPCDIRPGIGE